MFLIITRCCRYDVDLAMGIVTAVNDGDDGVVVVIIKAAVVVKRI